GNIWFRLAHGSTPARKPGHCSRIFFERHSRLRTVFLFYLNRTKMQTSNRLRQDYKFHVSNFMLL
ncbi:MAG: hypothetical protein LOD92_02370, partial [Bacillales bacterium]